MDAGATVDARVDEGLEVHRWTPVDGDPDAHDPRLAADGAGDRASIVLLHEALGSAGLWGRFPALLAARTGREVVAVSRLGHGRSAPLPHTRGPDYLDREARRLDDDLRRLVGGRPCVLVGHSDGATIALLHAMQEQSTAVVTGLVLMAPHVIVEERTIVGLRRVRERYEDGGLRERLARHHDDADALFRGWNDVWLSPAFRDWDITDGLPAVRLPALLVQCADDEYATLRQLDLIERGVSGPTTRLVPAVGGHAPHVAHTGRVLDAIDRFLDEPAAMHSPSTSRTSHGPDGADT